jgi:hypothetical protein
MDLLAAGSAAEAAQAFRSAIDLGESQLADRSTVRIEAHHELVRALRDAGRLEQSIGAALALTAIAPADPLAHTALSISLQRAGHVPEAEAAAARARVLEWKIQLRSPEEEPPPERNPPAQDPPAKDPPAEGPPAQHPPAKEPPSDDPPRHEPPSKETPVQEPPVQEPLAREPLARDAGS